MKGDLDGARRKLTDQVMGRDGVAGTAVGERDGTPCLVVYVTHDAARRGIPGQVGGYPVVVERSGPFRPL